MSDIFNHHAPSRLYAAMHGSAVHGSMMLSRKHKNAATYGSGMRVNAHSVKT